MSWVSGTGGNFAEALRHAIDQRGLGLERIRDRLNQRGVSISVATLSYWQSGRSRPERKASLAALPHLEDVLGVPPGSLHATLAPATLRRRRAPVVGLDELWPESPPGWVLSRLDTSWDTELDRLTVHDRLVIGADRRQVSLTVRQVLRARSDGPDRRVVLHSHEDLQAAPATLEPLRGCRLGRVVHDPQGLVLGAELEFLRPLRKGETAVTEYTLRSGSPGPMELLYQRRLRVPLTDYLLEVQFDAAALPQRVSAVTDCSGETPLELGPDHAVHLVSPGCTMDLAGIGWSWDDVDPVESS